MINIIILSYTFFAALFMTQSVLAASIFINTGMTHAQGYAFKIIDRRGHLYKGRTRCLILTAYHAVKNIQRIQVSDRDGAIYDADLLADDSLSDLALFQLVLPDGKKYFDNRTSKVTCGFGDGFSGGLGSHHIDMQSLSPLLGSTPITVAWIDRISTRAGGLDRVLLASDAHYEKSSIRVNTAINSVTISKGDSGASAWFYPPDSQSSDKTKRARLFNRDGKVSLKMPGIFMGIVISVNSNGVLLVPPETVYEFIFQALEPLNWSDISIEPKKANITWKRRGRFPWSKLRRAHNPGWGLVDSTGLKSLSFELDLGDRDTVVTGIEIEYTKLVRTDRRLNKTRIDHKAPIQLELGQNRPNKQTWLTFRNRFDDMQEFKCKSDNMRELISTETGYKFTCFISSSIIARSARLVVSADPISSVRVVRLLTHESNK